MSQTPRTRDELLAAFANNDAEAIDALQLRDFVESAMGCYGSIFVDGGTTNQELTDSNAAVLANWTTDGIARNVTPEALNNRLVIGASGIYLVSFCCSVFVLTSLKNMLFEARVLGVKLPGLSSRVGLSSTTQRMSAAFCRHALLSDGDPLQVYVTIEDGGFLRIEHAQLSVTRVG